MHDTVDAINCAKVNMFAKGKLEEGFSEAMVRAAVDELKICKKQARRIYEIICAGRETVLFLTQMSSIVNTSLLKQDFLTLLY